MTAATVGAQLPAPPPIALRPGAAPTATHPVRLLLGLLFELLESRVHVRRLDVDGSGGGRGRRLGQRRPGAHVLSTYITRVVSVAAADQVTSHELTI